jgi:hypothetical protein
MTLRTRLLANARLSFMPARLGHLPTTLRVPWLWHLLFERCGCHVETRPQVLYWVNTAGRAVSSRRLLAAVVPGLCALACQAQGQPLRGCLRAVPP